MVKQVFPKNFLWGASVASHQVEGGTHNQWSEWEVTNAQRLAKSAQKRLSWLPNWQGIKPEAQSPENYISGKGTEHYSRYAEDFGLVKELNMNAFRFGVEWSRLEPSEGQWDEKEVEHYRRYIAELKRLHIEPILTFWHWTMPVWFTNIGGFEKQQNLHYFERYVKKVTEEFCQDLRYVLILNEPNVYVSFGYTQGAWPPMRKNIIKTLQVYNNLAKTHRRNYQAIKSINPKLSVGIAAQLFESKPVSPNNVINKLITKTEDYVWNWWFLNRIKNQLDFIGLNYYFTQYLKWYGLIKNPPSPVNDLGWYMEPAGVGRLLEELWRRYHKPLIITENGLADANDTYRQWWIKQTINAMQEAIQHGVKLFGYLHWSLLDNFEWSYGWWPKFGLVAVDRQTMRRTIRPSARWFAKQIK
jgi:beta-glucosidase